MATKGKSKLTIELNPGDKETLQQIALDSGFVASTNPGKGSISKMLQTLASDEKSNLMELEPGVKISISTSNHRPWFSPKK